MKAVKERVMDLILFRELDAEIEEILVRQFEPIVNAFNEGDRSMFTLQRMRVRNRAQSNAKNLRQEIEDLRGLIALIPEDASE